MPRFAPVMSSLDLRTLLIDKAIENDYEEDYADIDRVNPDLDRIVMMLLEELLPAVEKDWAKVDFSWENFRVNAEKVTSGGVPYLECLVGGDWESPLVATVYFDGKTFRGFIPKKGNTYNHKTRAAFGNDDSDVAVAIKQCGFVPGPDDDYVDVDPDYAAVTAEIDSRIQPKGSFVPGSKPVVSKAANRAKEQARIEKDQDLSGEITAGMVYAIINLAAGGSYVSFQLRSSRRQLTIDECNRLVGVPARLEKHEPFGGSKTVLWYSPMGTYPAQTLELLEAAGFSKAPDNDISHYAGARTVYINL